MAHSKKKSITRLHFQAKIRILFDAPASQFLHLHQYLMWCRLVAQSPIWQPPNCMSHMLLKVLASQRHQAWSHVPPPLARAPHQLATKHQTVEATPIATKPPNEDRGDNKSKNVSPKMPQHKMFATSLNADGNPQCSKGRKHKQMSW